MAPYEGGRRPFESPLEGPEDAYLTAFEDEFGEGPSGLPPPEWFASAPEASAVPASMMQVDALRAELAEQQRDMAAEREYGVARHREQEEMQEALVRGEMAEAENFARRIAAAQAEKAAERAEAERAREEGRAESDRARWEAASERLSAQSREIQDLRRLLSARRPQPGGGRPESGPLLLGAAAGPTAAARARAVAGASAYPTPGPPGPTPDPRAPPPRAPVPWGAPTPGDRSALLQQTLTDLLSGVGEEASGGGRRGILKLEKLKEELRRSPGTRLGALDRVLTQFGVSTVEEFVNRFTQCRRDRAHLYPVTLTARALDAVRQGNWPRVTSLLVAALNYEDQLALEGNLNLAWSVTLEEDPYAVARDPGLPLRRAFPKTSHLAPREAFGRSLPPRTVEAVLASGKDWRALREVATSMTD